MHTDLQQCEVQVINIFLKHYVIHEAERVPIIKNYSWKIGMHFIHSLKDKEQELCNTVGDLFKV